jgi:hypothetical protein
MPPFLALRPFPVPPMKTDVLYLLLGILATIPPTAFAQTVLYAEDFAGDATTALSGTTPDTTTNAATWIAGSRFKTDGILTAATGNHGAWLPFIPTPGNSYAVTADLNTTAGGQNWISLGFSGAATALPNNRFADGPVVAMASFLVRANRATGTGATDAQFFVGETTNKVTSFPSPPTGVVTARITLDAADPDSTNWTTALFINGIEQTLAFNAMPLDGSDAGTDASRFSDIKFVGFTIANANVEGTIDNFRVEVNNGGPHVGPPFEITRIEPVGTLGTAGAIARITFNSRIGRTYILQYSENLQTWFDTEFDFFTATTESSTLAETLAAANFPGVFYHVREAPAQ